MSWSSTSYLNECWDWMFLFSGRHTTALTLKEAGCGHTKLRDYQTVRRKWQQPSSEGWALAFSNFRRLLYGCGFLQCLFTFKDNNILFYWH